MSLGFSSAISGLRVAQAAIQTIGQNVSNQATPGYSRQNVLLTSANPIPQQGFLFGSGAKLTGVSRSVDELLLGRVRTQESLLGYYSVQYNRLSELESYLNEPGENGLGALMSKFFGSVSSLSSNPDDGALREAMLNSSKGLSQTFKQLSGRIREFRASLATEIESQAASANQLADQIALLNAQVLSLEGGTGASANDVRDQRDEAVKKLSHLVGVTAIEDSNGAVRIQVAGYTIVSNTTSTDLELAYNDKGLPELGVKGTGTKIPKPGGSIGGLIASYSANGDEVEGAIDKVAKNLILNVNRVHSTGVGRTGSYAELVSLNPPTDTNGNGNFGDERLNNVGLPFEITSGNLYVNVVNKATGDIKTSKVAIDASVMTLSGFANALSSIDNLDAAVDSTGRLRITALDGYEFDFAPRLDQNPNTEGTFGSSSGKVSSSLSEPFGLANGDVLGISIDGAAATNVTFSTSDFANINLATASEVVAKINTVLGGAYASAVNGRVVISSLTAGSSSSVQLTNGTGNPATDMGLSTSADTGDATTVSVEIGGTYTGSTNDKWVFRPDSGGTIGVTSGLTVGVYNSSGGRVATLNVGANYTPGDEMLVADGVTVSFGPGVISSNAGDFTQLEVVHDSDTSDVLVGLGINCYFIGKDATDIEVNPEIAANGDLIAASLTSESGDNSNLLRMLDTQNQVVDDLDQKTLENYYGSQISKLGFDVSGSLQLLNTQTFVTENLEVRRQQISGVSVEEELSSLLQFQQMYQAISKYMTVLTDLERTLIGSL